MFDPGKYASAFRYLAIATAIKSVRNYDRAQRFSTIKSVSSLMIRIVTTQPAMTRYGEPEQMGFEDFERSLLDGADLDEVIDVSAQRLQHVVRGPMMHLLVQYLYLAVNPPAAYRGEDDNKSFPDGDMRMLNSIYRKLGVSQREVDHLIANCPEDLIGAY